MPAAARTKARQTTGPERSRFPARTPDDEVSTKARKLAKTAKRPAPGNVRWKPIQKSWNQPNGAIRVQSMEDAWTDARHLVRHFLSMGYNEETICQMMLPPISRQQLHKAFGLEMKLGREIQNARVGATAFQMAVSGQDGSMTRFWLRSRAGWKDFDVEGGNQPLRVEMIDGDETI